MNYESARWYLNYSFRHPKKWQSPALYSRANPGICFNLCWQNLPCSTIYASLARQTQNKPLTNTKRHNTSLCWPKGAPIMTKINKTSMAIIQEYNHSALIQVALGLIINFLIMSPRAYGLISYGLISLWTHKTFCRIVHYLEKERSDAGGKGQIWCWRIWVYNTHMVK